ncbi:MAG: neutral/alkaline non-lysosomal ceramidase N-terminal domain-containing protein [Planctomycetales bacterium]|nr:neutral/alkaline non-lysosomal ceramidase N-terminal domain-containing protein [Planctomycetales bacterium]
MKPSHALPCLYTLLCLIVHCCGANPGYAAEAWRAGFSKVDITPQEPVRMSGYGNRDHPSEGVETKLYVRAVCLEPDDPQSDKARLVLLTVDNVGLSGARTRRLAAEIESAYGIDRAHVVFCNTHTHSAPHLADQLANIFTKPLSGDESDAAARYQTLLDAQVLLATKQAINDLKPARLAFGMGEAGFAANRRVLTDGRWTAFGVQPDGPVDHSVPLLRITAPDGTVRGLVFNYACHCTTLGGDYYKINADWAGHATTQLEETFPDAVALCTIGCGADANPNPRGTAEMAQMHGSELAGEVKRLAQSELSPITSNAEAHFDYAALSFDLPTREELEQRLTDSQPQNRRHAELMIKILGEKGRLPATYPVPIQSWKFGDQLTMVFLGGEVVVDYAIRLKKTFDDPQLWVTAYANDVMGYVASERMRAEGGYEYDRSGIYYSLPGPWASGSEDLLIQRVEDLVRKQGRPGPQSTDASLKSIHVAPNYEIDLVASEPLIQDPVNIAFGDDGRLWVVEMGDYPEGTEGGRVKTLTDVDGDGTFDEVVTFLSGIPFPTGVQPWKDGVLISAAPDVLFARDTTGDGRADDVKTLYTGFRLANPQHRINGFTYGLDHSLHLASGDNLAELTSLVSGQKINASGHDVQIWPDSGAIAATSGRTQFARSRDSCGHWFGNNNSLPMFHFPIEDRYLKRNPAVSFSANTEQLFSPPLAPPVFPLTSAAERFNDLFAANRFTSACSSIVSQSPFFQAGNNDSILICEPVHNLVHRSSLVPNGSSFLAKRIASEMESEFIASTDPWFRPVRAMIGPDGMLYIVDMYREVIEHPEWIPDAWQERLNLRAGEHLGRIYRIRPTDHNPAKTPNLAKLPSDELVELLRSPIGALRDQAQRLLLHREVSNVRERLEEMALHESNAFARLHALAILDVAGLLRIQTLTSALSDPNPGVLIVATRIAENHLSESAELLESLTAHATHPDPSVALQVALALGQTESEIAGKALARIALRPDLDRWLSDAVASSSSHHASIVADAIFSHAASQNDHLADKYVQLLERVLLTAKHGGSGIEQIIGDKLISDKLPIDTRLGLAECIVRVSRSSDNDYSALVPSLGPLVSQAKSIAADPDQPESVRCSAISLIGLNLDNKADHQEILLSLLHPISPVSVQCQVIDALTEKHNQQTIAMLIQRWPTFSNAVREHLISKMLERRNLSEVLLQTLQAETIRVNEISLSAREQLVKTGSRSMRVQAERLINSGQSKQRGTIVREHLARFSVTGNQSETDRKAEIELGQSLFKKHCGTCHSPDATGVAIGASLANLTNRSDAALVESILDPNRAVEPKYQNYLIQTDDGRTLSGVIESEVGDSVTLAHADGKKSTILRSRIEQMKGTGTSLMPEGFETTLKPEELKAIVRYLQQ